MLVVGCWSTIARKPHWLICLAVACKLDICHRNLRLDLVGLKICLIQKQKPQFSNFNNCSVVGFGTSRWFSSGSASTYVSAAKGTATSSSDATDRTSVCHVRSAKTHSGQYYQFWIRCPAAYGSKGGASSWDTHTWA